jgi:hypothetical protein
VVARRTYYVSNVFASIAYESSVAFEDFSIGDWNRSSSNGETKSPPALHSFFDAAKEVLRLGKAFISMTPVAFHHNL